MVARYLCPGRNDWKVLPTISDPPETMDSIGVGVSNGIGGKESFLVIIQKRWENQRWRIYVVTGGRFYVWWGNYSQINRWSGVRSSWLGSLSSFWNWAGNERSNSS